MEKNNGVSEAFETNDRVIFDLFESAEKLHEYCILPDENQSIRMISPAGGWSSCSLLLALSDKAKIGELYITTLRVGKKELQALCGLDIKKVHFALGGISRENAEKYDYSAELESVCAYQGWTYTYLRNHSKVILAKTNRGKIVIETSSNFNENPQIEQFCISNSAALYDFYVQQFKALGVFAEG